MKRLPISTERNLQRGLSIVEILVVILILLFGVLSIIKVFPSGFLVMRNTSNLNRADRVESAMLAGMTVGGNVPGGVYCPNAYSSTLGQTFNLTFDPTDPNNLNAGNYIKSEPFTVPSATTTNPDPIVVLPLGPISYTTGVTGANGITVVSANWKEIQAKGTVVPTGGATATSNNTEAQVLTDGEYAVDTTDSANGYQIVFPVANYDQTFNISYNSGGVTKTVQLTLPAGTIDYANPTVPPSGSPAYFNSAAGSGGYRGYWDTLADLIAEYAGTAMPATWDPGSLQISRPLSAGITPAAGSDPYQYQVDSNADIAANSINLGVIQFSPNASPNILGHELKVLVSYSVYDWHILHEDQNLNGASDLVTLAVTGLKQPGEIYDQAIFNNLFPAGSATNGAMVALDLDTGAAMTVPNSSITFSTGHVSLASGFATTHPRVRFFYETVDDLGLALQQAPTTFQEATLESDLSSASTTTPNLWYKDLSWNDSNGDQILFPAAYAGQTIQLENVVWGDTTGANTYSLGNLTVNISKSTELVGSQQLAYADITNILVNAARQETIATGTTVNISSGGNAWAFKFTGIGGVSARAVCIWHEAGKWKIHNVDTILN